MAQSWRDSGGIWTAVSSRILSACLQLCLDDSSKLNVAIISVYGAPIGHLLRSRIGSLMICRL